MSGKIIKQAKLNAFAAYFYFLLNAVVGFVVTPLIAANIGIIDFGIWKGCQKILDFASISDGKTSQALKWIIANKESSDDLDEKKQAIGAALVIWGYFIPFLLITVGVLVYFLPELIKGIPDTKFELVRIIGILLGANIVMAPLFGIPDAVLIGTNRGYISTCIQALWFVLTNIAIVLVTYLGYGLKEIALIGFLAPTLNATMLLFVTKRKIDWFGIKWPQKKQISVFFKFSGWVQIWALIEKALLSTELLLLGIFAGPELITHYTFTSYAVQFGLAITLLTTSAITPRLGKTIGEGDFNKARRHIESLREIIFFMTVLFSGSLVALNGAFVKLWVGEVHFMGDTVNLLIVACMAQLMLLRSEGQIQDLTLNIKNKVIYGLASIVLSPLLAVLFYKLGDNKIELLFAGVFIGRLILSITLPLMVNRFIKKTKFNIGKLLPGICIIGLCFIFGQKYEISDWIDFIIAICLLELLVVLASFMFLLSKENKRFMLTVIKINNTHEK